MLVLVLSLPVIFVIAAVFSALGFGRARAKFTRLPILDTDKLTEETLKLGAECRGAKVGGAGLDVYSAVKSCEKAYSEIKGKIAGGTEPDECETEFADGFRYVAAAEGGLRDLRFFRDLPHADNVPRVYLFAELVLKSSGGYVSRDALVHYASAFGEACPFDVTEADALPSAFTVAALDECARVAVAIINRNERIRAAQRDALEEKIDVARLSSAAYVKTLSELSEGKFRDEIVRICADNGFSVESREAEFYASVSRDKLALSGALKTLRSSSRIFDRETVLSLSGAAARLKNARGYDMLTTGTKAYFLGKIADKSKREKTGEAGIAERIVSESERENGDLAEYLIPKPSGAFCYFALTVLKLLLTAAAAVGVWFFTPAHKFAVALLSVPSAYFVVKRMVERYAAAGVKPRILPEYSFEKTDPAVGANLVCTRLVSSAAEAKEAVFNLAVTAKANPSPRFSYTLLVDLPPATREKSDEDDAIISALVGAFDGLGERFNLLIRSREPDSDGKYCGRERKRGALLALNGLILRDDAAPFRIVRGTTYAKKYVIALDADTRLDCADRLVGIAEHPYNAKYAVMSVRAYAAPKSLGTLFARVFSGASGVSDYDGAVGSGLGWETFGVGNFTGKGIYRVAEFDRATGNAFPDGRILSHDFIEGAYAGCGESRLPVIDDFPPSFAVYTERNLRWIRGDAQLLPYLFPAVKNKAGRRVRNPIGIVAKGRILGNILSPLRCVFTFALTVFAAVTGSLAAACTALLPVAAEMIFAFGYGSAKLSAKEISASLTRFAFTPALAVFHLAAIVKTMRRLVVKKRLLEWKTFAHSKGVECGLPQFFLTFALFALNLFFGKNPIVYVLCAAFVLAVPFGAFSAEKDKPAAISEPRSRGFLTLAAERTWRYFADAITEKTNFLPPDNYDERSGKGYAYRTSPTDIGMSLVAVFCAEKLNIIRAETARDLLKNIVNSIEKLPKWNGNLYNWYDPRTLSVLPPAYVSSVDEGNFLCSLLLVRSITDHETSAKIDEIVARADLGALYDPDRGLMRIGVETQSGRFDGHYDLLASESEILYLVGAGTGKIPRSAWKNLSRRKVTAYGKTAFASWTGGAFEYLMTPLFFGYEKETALYKSARAAAFSQVRYGKNKPFYGVSESIYAAREDNGDYKYKASGVPALALSGESEGSAFSPYACALTLPFFAGEACASLEEYEASGARGRFGFFDAIDGEPLRCYMTHHQGMTMAAITNVLCDGAITEELGTRPEIAACEILLSEREYSDKPKKIKRRPLACKKETYSYSVSGKQRKRTFAVRFNGSYYAAIAENGMGDARFGETEVYRKSGIRLTVSAGAAFYDLLSGGATLFTSDGAEFAFNEPLVCGKVIARVLCGTVGEMRKVTIRNRSDSAITVTLDASCEPVLGSEDDDLSHPEFYAMKLRFDNRGDCLVAERPSVCAYAAFGIKGVAARLITDRRYFYGRRKEETKNVADGILGARSEISLGAGEEKTAYVYILVSHDRKKLDSAVALVSSYGFFERCDYGGRSDVLADKYYTAASSAVGCYEDDTLSSVVNIAMPTVCVKAENYAGGDRLRRRLKALCVAARAGARFNVAVVYREKAGYFGTLSVAVNREIERSGINGLVRGGKVVAVNAERDEKTAALLLKSAVVPAFPGKESPRRLLGLVSLPYDTPDLPSPELVLKTGKGGFTESGEYYIPLDSLPVKPWSNVIANEKAGFVVTETGGGFTYAGNSRENKITAYSGDTVLDPPSERIVLCENGNEWKITRNGTKIAENKNAKYYAIHGFGYSEFVCAYNGAIGRLTVFTGVGKTKYYLVSVKNTVAKKRVISVGIELDLVLGNFEKNTLPSLNCRKEGENLKAYCALTGTEVELACSRESSFYTFSAGGEQGEKGRSFAIKSDLEIAPDGESEVVFALFSDDKPNFKNVRDVLCERRKYFSSLSPVMITEGESALGFLHNRLIYQTLSSRFFARAGLYQVSGAYGFRDQLQDAMAIVSIEPGLVREHILRCAARQFPEGDALHWWHEPAVGVRTKITDDRLFLPWATARYVKVTRDEDVLRERVNYLRGDPVPRGVKNVYRAYEAGFETDSLLAHCLNAIESTELSPDGIALLKGGDWNDGIDEAGEKGTGTSTFTTMLLYRVITDFLPYVHERTARERLIRLREKARGGIDKAWRGNGYVRLTTDEGVELGTDSSPEDKCDLLTAAWAGICGACEKIRVIKAQDAALERLFDKKNKVLRLLDPPFKNMSKIGYITEYPAGVRENGGQYTHAAAWFIISLIKTGRYEKAEELLFALSPVSHTLTEKDSGVYAAEPYVVCGDVYASGEGGWSWYTGAAGWLYIAITEFWLGISTEGDSVTFDPHFVRPESVKVKIRRAGVEFCATIKRGVKGGRVVISVGGVTYNGDTIRVNERLAGKTITVDRVKSD